ncbi:hypothetical protein GOP47_0010057 [Adiantum capillus-veneris]|uniref:Enoyl reductase (ER) domain-containing protein n=1 Tax=Adiantum capillus-veneris TaxID=13818 RepID=A0A9D4ZIE8_ADICA|nr:hypothetical protein GOP47_0010057 [Adiantum capillus-veneris]
MLRIKGEFQQVQHWRNEVAHAGWLVEHEGLPFAGVYFDQHVQLPIPVPQRGEVLVKVESASVNPIDWKVQSGALKPFLPSKFPYIPGTDIAGEVVAVGSGVTTLKKGDKVFSWLGLGAGGSLAEFAIAPAKSTVQKPQEIASIEACCLPVAGLTALQSIRDYAGIKVDGNSQANLLITGASGGVGLYAVQIAKLCGAHVTATCGARNMELIKNLGADEVVDYKSAEGAELRSPSGRAYDAVIHCTSGIPWSTFSANLKPVAKVIDLTPNIKSLATTALKKLAMCQQELVPYVLSAKAEDLDLLAELARGGKLRTIIDSQHPLSRAEEAWARSIEGHATGKIVVTA